MPSQTGRLASVSGAALDGRTSNVRFQQSQLIALHNRLQELRNEVCEAILSDRSVTAAEAEVEYSSTVLAIKEYYHSIDFDQAMKDEYRVAQGQDAANRRVGYGVILIRPTEHTRAYSILVAAAAAIAAGNTFVIECGDFAVDRILPTILQSLDIETYALIDGKVTETEREQISLVVDQTGELSTPHCLPSHPQLRSIAVVDRTANVEQAASAIVSAHVAYRGASPHAPDLILVNEWVKKEFVDACIRLAPQNPLNQRPTAGDWRQAVSGAERSGEVAVLGSTSLTILDVRKRSSSLVGVRPEGSYLPLLTVSSLVDAVVALEGSNYLVAYHFAGPAEGKFLSQQIDSRSTFVNRIPLPLLVGPALPLYNGQPSPSPFLRYTTEMLSRSRPEYIQSSKGIELIVQDLKALDQAALQRLRSEVERPLRSTGQGPGTAIGFFEQGILVGAVFIVLPTISLIGYSSWYMIRSVIWR